MIPNRSLFFTDLSLVVVCTSSSDEVRPAIIMAHNVVAAYGVNCASDDNCLKVVYSDDDHCERFSAMRQSSLVPDISLYGCHTCTSGFAEAREPINAHKRVLSIVSKHLCDAFCHLNDSGSAVYQFDNIEHDALRAIIDLSYGGRVALDFNAGGLDALCDIVIGAEYLAMDRLKDACESFIINKCLNTASCIEWWGFAKFYHCSRVTAAAIDLFAEMLPVFVDCPELRSLSCDELGELFSSDIVKKVKPAQRWRVAAAALGGGKGRLAFLDDILKCLPDATLSLQARSKLSEAASRSVRNSYRKTTAESSASMQLSTSVETSSLPTRFGAPQWHVLGGAPYDSWDNNGVGLQFVTYNCSSKLWSARQLPWERDSGTACAISGQRLLFAGGMKYDITDEQRTEKEDVDIFDFSTWTTHARLFYTDDVRPLHDRVMLCADGGGENVYAFGMKTWHEASQRMATRAVKYSTLCNTVSAIAPESPADIPTRQDGVAVYAPNWDAIYIVGGWRTPTPEDFFGCVPISGVSKYSCSIDKWRMNVGDISPRHIDCAATLVGDELYIAGGFDGFVPSHGVEVFNISTGQQRAAPNLLTARGGCRAAVLDHNVVCVLGGKTVRRNATAATVLASVEALDVREGKPWSTGVIVPDMPTGCADFGLACTL